MDECYCAAWKEDIQAGLLFKIELHNDPTFPKWWIESVLSKIIIPISNDEYNLYYYH